MKPEHFIYKLDGLYYMHNIPNNCYYYYRDERTQTEEFDHKSYNEALERAKTEAVKVVEGDLLIAEYIIKQVHDIHEVKDYRKGMKSYLEEGCVYTINMEEKIEIVDTVEHKDWVVTGNLMKLPVPNKFARIAAPKKEEETQEQILSELLDEFHSWCIGISFDPEGKDNRTRDEFIKDKLKAIEIKRKP